MQPVRIQVFEPTLQLRHYNASAKASVASKNIDNGAAAAAFEEAIAKRIDVPRSWVAVTNSCTAALTCAYHFLVGDRPLAAPVLTWPGTYVGHRGPVRFYDLSFWSQQAKDVGGVVWVDLYGMGEHQKPAGYGVPTIIDAAHHCFRPFNPLLCDAMAYSFGPIKELSTIHGGCLISPHMTWEWRAFLHYGAVGRDPYMVQAGNYCMPDFNARLGLSQLPEFDENRGRRQDLLHWYTARLSGLMLTRVWPDAPKPSGHIAVARFGCEEERDFVRAFLSLRGIQTSRHYPLPRHLPPDLFPHSKALSDTVLTLPLHLGLTEAQVDEVCAAVKEALSLCVKKT